MGSHEKDICVPTKDAILCAAAAIRLPTQAMAVAIRPTLTDTQRRVARPRVADSRVDPLRVSPMDRATVVYATVTAYAATG